MIIVVPTGAKSSYTFRIHPLSPNRPEVENEGGHHYHSFDGRGAVAVKRLMEEFQKYRSFFDAVKLLSHTQDVGHEFLGFFDQNDRDYNEVPGADEAWELVGQMVEEACHAEDVQP